MCGVLKIKPLKSYSKTDSSSLQSTGILATTKIKDIEREAAPSCVHLG